MFGPDLAVTAQDRAPARVAPEAAAAPATPDVARGEDTPHQPGHSADPPRSPTRQHHSARRGRPSRNPSQSRPPHPRLPRRRKSPAGAVAPGLVRFGPGAAPRRLAGRGQPAQRPPADQAAHRGLPPGRRRRADRDPRVPGGAGVPQGRRRAPPARDRSRDIGRHRPSRERSLRRRQRRARGTGSRSIWSPKPDGSSPTSWRTSARSANDRKAAEHDPFRQTDRHDTDERRHPMGMANLQRMAQQMQQEMLRIQTELEFDPGRRFGRRRRRQRDRDRQAGACQRDHRSVGGRPERRRDAPGPGRRGRQRRAPRVARSSPSRRWRP